MSHKENLNISLCTTRRALSDALTSRKKCPKYVMGFFYIPNELNQLGESSQFYQLDLDQVKKHT